MKLQVLINNGLDENTPASQLRFIKLLNPLAFISATFALTFLPVLLPFGESGFHLLATIACTVIANFSVLLIIRQQYYLFAKLTFQLSNTVFFVVLYFQSNGTSTIFYYFLLVILVAFFIYNRQERIFRIGFISIASILFTFFSIHSHFLVVQNTSLLFKTLNSYFNVGLLIYFTGFLVYIYMGQKNYEQNLSESREKVLYAKERTESLLLNILPQEVAQQLKEFGKAEPIHIPMATILFTDFVGFTRTASQLSPSELVSELDLYFSAFDEITSRYNLEKLKTIGDSYMCAGGIPLQSQSHAIDCCLAALEIQKVMQRIREERNAKGIPGWELRIGINSGPIVAGVIGQKKFAYDVWGDTVNIAARMEQNSTARDINISLYTYELVKDFFVCEHRGEIEVKGKGAMPMFFLKSAKMEFSSGENGKQVKSGEIQVKKEFY